MNHRAALFALAFACFVLVAGLLFARWACGLEDCDRKGDELALLEAVEFENGFVVMNLRGVGRLSGARADVEWVGPGLADDTPVRSVPESFVMSTDLSDESDTVWVGPWKRQERCLLVLRSMPTSEALVAGPSLENLVLSANCSGG